MLNGIGVISVYKQLFFISLVSSKKYLSRGQAGVYDCRAASDKMQNTIKIYETH